MRYQEILSLLRDHSVPASTSFLEELKIRAEPPKSFRTDWEDLVEHARKRRIVQWARSGIFEELTLENCEVIASGVSTSRRILARSPVLPVRRVFSEDLESGGDLRLVPRWSLKRGVQIKLYGEALPNSAGEVVAHLGLQHEVLNLHPNTGLFDLLDLTSQKLRRGVTSDELLPVPEEACAPFLGGWRSGSETSMREDSAVFLETSKDGKWLVYACDETGTIANTDGVIKPPISRPFDHLVQAQRWAMLKIPWGSTFPGPL